MLEIVKQSECKFQFKSEKISLADFVQFMQLVSIELSRTLSDVTERINILSSCAKTVMLPSFLQPGQTLLGKFFIQNVISFKEIFDNDLLSLPNSVFSGVKSLKLNQSAQTTGARNQRQKNAFKVTANTSDKVSKAEGESSTSELMSYLTLLKTNYSFRLKTIALFEPD